MKLFQEPGCLSLSRDRGGADEILEVVRSPILHDVLDVHALVGAIDYRETEARKMRIGVDHPVPEFVDNTVGLECGRRQHRHAAVPDAAAISDMIPRSIKRAAVLMAPEPAQDQVAVQNRLQPFENGIGGGLITAVRLM